MELWINNYIIYIYKLFDLGDQARVLWPRDPAAGLHQHPQRPAPRERQRGGRSPRGMGDGELTKLFSLNYVQKCSKYT